MNAKDELEKLIGKGGAGSPAPSLEKAAPIGDELNAEEEAQVGEIVAGGGGNLKSSPAIDVGSTYGGQRTNDIVAGGGGN